MRTQYRPTCISMNLYREVSSVTAIQQPYTSLYNFLEIQRVFQNQDCQLTFFRDTKVPLKEFHESKAGMGNRS